ncbi:CPBP family intramembrane glutamic endopeptidase [Catellatospora paridis]|uniref:CPBP family intramembrane glutamic endopeptidase n=1 Tax=Catellatospora paridis TaxID=1617086 RepID=UPI0012D44A54|nr:CPBP family intramembrane glutamic endopeptidase [Catellatospora paridis]
MHEELTYERLARLGFHRWWTPLAAVLAAALVAATAVCGLVVIALAVTWALGGNIDDGASIGSPLVDNLLALASIALLLPVTLGVARLVQRRPAGMLHSVVGRLRWRWFAVCGCLAAVVAVLVIVALVSVYGSLADLRLTIDPWRFLGLAVLLVVLVPLQAAGEEYATRGFVLQALGAYHRWVGILGSALAFTLLHGIGTWSGFVALFVGGVIWALLVIRTGGLEVSIAAHAATNLFAFVATAATGGLDIADTTTAADATLGSTLILLGGDLTYMACVIVALKVVAQHRPGWMPANRTPAIEKAETSIVQVEANGADASAVHR